LAWPGTALASAREPKIDGAFGSRSKSYAGPCATHVAGGPLLSQAAPRS
jgi:hypothetical protein